jgi:hypothetical protein
MPRRLSASFAFAFTFVAPALALADVPPADGGAGGSSTATVADGGGVNPECTIDNQGLAGTTCVVCDVTSSDTSCALELGGSYAFACQQSATKQVWCNGPSGTSAPGAGCTLGGAPVPAGPAGAVFAAVLGLAAWSVRRRSVR